MDVGKDQVRVALEAVEHAVAVVRIDVHVGNAFQAVIAAKHFHRHAAVVEHAESRGAAARRVMQSGDGDEGAPRAPCHDFLGGEQRRADHVRGGFVNATPRRRIAGVQVPLARQ